MTTTPTAPFIEPGEAFRRLGGYESPAAQPRFDVIVIGGARPGFRSAITCASAGSGS